MTRAEIIKEKLRKELASLRKGKCWIHGDKLQITITQPFEGFPADHMRKIDKEFPFHALYVHVGCMPLTSNEAHGQRTSMCLTCNKFALQFLQDIEDL
jgi:hypothetical protein